MTSHLDLRVVQNLPPNIHYVRTEERIEPIIRIIDQRLTSQISRKTLTASTGSFDDGVADAGFQTLIVRPDQIYYKYSRKWHAVCMRNKISCKSAGYYNGARTRNAMAQISLLTVLRSRGCCARYGVHDRIDSIRG